MIALVVAVIVAVAFDVTNGFHDSANSVAALVATRAARPGAALMLAGACHVAGPLLMGTAVADTVGGVVELPASVVVAAVGAAVTAAIGWNLFTWWRGLPSSSSHALVGGLVGACVATQGLSAVRWGGFGDGHVDGVLGVLVGLAISPLLGAGIGGWWARRRGGCCGGHAAGLPARPAPGNGLPPLRWPLVMVPTTHRRPWA